MNKNEKTFRLVNKIATSFSIIVANFEYAATLLFNIRDRIRITFIPALLIKMSTVINSKRVRIIISQVKLIVRITQTINTKRVRLFVSVKQRMKAVADFYLRNPILFVSKVRQKLVVIVYEGKLRIITSPVFVILYTLGHWDTYTLLLLDSMTLEDMDYTTV